jgi:hypothetical protein
MAVYVVFRKTLKLILVCAVATALLRFQPTSLEARELQSVSIGCPADGQAGPIPAPKQSARTVPTAETLPEKVAYYRGHPR